jgi:hypothetical protein
VNQTANPFSDTNAIRDPPPALPKPTTYVADIRRSRSDSTSLPSNSGGRQPSTAYHPSRDSIGSLRSLATATTTNQRNKFRSDPFDLERPELLGGTVTTKTTIRPGPPPPRSSSISSSTAATAGSTAAAPTPEPQQQQQQKQPQPPARARTRAESFTSRYSKYSKYSSGISVVSAVSEEESLGGDWSDPGPDVGPAATATSSNNSNAKWGVVSGGDDGGRGRVVQGWRERLAREREEVVTVVGRGGGVQGGGGGRKMSGGSLGSVGKAM